MMFEALDRSSLLTKSHVITPLAGTRLASAFLTEMERHALARAASAARAIKANTDLLREGEVADQIYVVLEGWACRYKTSRDGTRQIVALLAPGEVANLDTLMFRRSDTGVRVLSAAKIVSYPRERLMALASEHNGIGRALTRLALVENAILSQRLLCVGRLSAYKRLAHLFCELAVRSSENIDFGSITFEMLLTQEQLGDALGLTSVHINRTVRHLCNEGLIVKMGHSITISDVCGLRNMAGFDPAYLHLGNDEPSAPHQAFGAKR